MYCLNLTNDQSKELFDVLVEYNFTHGRYGGKHFEITGNYLYFVVDFEEKYYLGGHNYRYAYGGECTLKQMLNFITGQEEVNNKCSCDIMLLMRTGCQCGSNI